MPLIWNISEAAWNEFVRGNFLYSLAISIIRFRETNLNNGLISENKTRQKTIIAKIFPSKLLINNPATPVFRKPKPVFEETVIREFEIL